ncbi:MAG: tetratricopeptide repeat protein [Pseudonocardiaceae bacterium]
MKQRVTSGESCSQIGANRVDVSYSAESMTDRNSRPTTPDGPEEPGRSAHDLRCAERLRLRLLLEAGEPPEPSTVLHHAISRRIAGCCGHSALKSHRLAWGWTVDQAVNALHAMCRAHQLGARGLGERSWLGWEAGGLPNDDYRDLLCRLFKTGPVALGFGRDYTPDSVPDVASEPRAPRAPVQQKGSPADRRQALKLGGQATLGAAVGVGAGLSDLSTDAAADAMEFTRRAEASNIGPHTVEHLELAIAAMAAGFAHTPPAELFTKARWYRQKVASLIDSQHTLRQGRDLYRCAGWLSIVLGWLSHDLGDSVAADAYCLDAWEHGWQAEDGAVCAMAMDAQASTAMYNHRPATARDAAIKGLSRAPEGSAAATRVSAQLARACARMGAYDHFTDTLHATRIRLDEVETQDSTLFSVDTGRVASYAASSYIWLGQPQQAAPYAKEAIAFYSNVSPEERSPTREAIARLDLALAYVALGAPEDAAREIDMALASERLTGSVVSRLGDLATMMNRKYPQLDVTRAVHDHSLILATTLSRPALPSA